MIKCNECERYRELLIEILDVMTDDGMERHFYKTISNLYSNAEHIYWGDGLNMLIVSDRGHGRAKALYKFVTQKTNFSKVDIVTNMAEFYEYIKSANTDIIVFAGMQKDNANYKIFDLMKENNSFAFQAMYASLDEYVEAECRENNIYCIGDCNAPLSHFIMKLMQNYTNHRLRVEKAIEDLQKETFDEPRVEIKISLVQKIMNFIHNRSFI